MSTTALQQLQVTARFPIRSGWDELFLYARTKEIMGLPVTVPDFDAELHVETTTIMFADVVESVRLIQQDEIGNVSRIRSLLKRFADNVVPAHCGTVLERRGDGLLVKFANARDAITCAAHLHQRDIGTEATSGEEFDAIFLRIGIHTAEVLTDDSALYGLGVSVTARVAAQAGPGETIITAEARDQLTPGVDADLEDIGECFLKHVERNVRLYRSSRVELQVGLPIERDESLLPSLAVVPLTAMIESMSQDIIGEIFADGVVSCVSHSRRLRVISRLSSTALKDRSLTSSEIANALNVDYVLTGRYLSRGDRLLLSVELAHRLSADVVWAERFDTTTDDLLDIDSETVGTVSVQVAIAIDEHVVSRSRNRPLPTLESAALLFGAVKLAHRTSLSDFERPKVLLEHLIERHARVATPRAWLAHWYVLRTVQGQTSQRNSDAQVAIRETDRALEIEPRNSLALATRGFVYCHLLKDLDTAEKCYRAALESNPSDAFAWAYLGALHSFRSEGQAAEDACANAIGCSPLDPMRHFFDSLAAGAAFTNFRYDDAVRLARLALRGDRYHASPVRILAMSLAMTGQVVEGREMAKEMLKIDPSLTISTYMNRTPSADYEVGKRCADALRLVGIPE